MGSMTPCFQLLAAANDSAQSSEPVYRREYILMSTEFIPTTVSGGAGTASDQVCGKRTHSFKTIVMS
jgi:hypothetical protein